LIYEFKDKTTGEVIEKIMKIAEKPQFLIDNPNLESFISFAPKLIDPARLGIRKPTDGFKDVLRKINSRTPGSILGSTTNI